MVNIHIQKHCALWGNPAYLDLQGQYFNEETNFGFNLEDLPLEFPVVVINEEAKEVGFASISYDKDGLIADVYVDPENDYTKAVKTLIDMGYMTPTLWADETKIDMNKEKTYLEEDGYITYWPVKQILLTVTPVDTRLMESNHGTYL